MDTKAKSQIVEKLKGAQNVLVSVSVNPSVDQLAAAIGLTLLLNKLDKHATAVFSGQVPSTLEFLKPEGTLERTTDSLRDFIISLDKAKADKLRYKVEENVVKIFITPYRTHLTQDDLNFEQGDFNVDVVVALGVDIREHLDEAIMAHGRILHDATVVSVMAGPNPSDVGSINWQDVDASSLSEMLVSVGESLKSGILDEQIATALLTGIVAETERFSNSKTTPKVMTVSAKLMAAGANQQLIASELQPTVVAADAQAQDVSIPEQDSSVLSVFHQDQAADQAVDTPQSDDVALPAIVEAPASEEIHIDEHGTVRQPKDYDNMAQMVEEIQAASGLKPRPGGITRGKTIQPLEPTSGDDAADVSADDRQYSPYLTEQQSDQPPMSASIDFNDELPLIDPLAPVVYDNSEQEKVPIDTQSPLISVQDDAESFPSIQVPSTRSLQLTDDGVTAADIPLGPPVQPTDTLDQIEDKVEDFTRIDQLSETTTPSEVQPFPGVQLPEPPTEVPTTDGIAPAQTETGLDPDAARKAVEAAMAASGGYDPNRPTPLQSLNAQPLSSAPSLPVDGSSATPPPAVPPPLIPPFPVPGSDQQQNGQ